MIYRGIRRYARLLVTCWYRVDIAGDATEVDGPLIVVGNHTNGLVDVAFLVASSSRPLRFLAKFSLFKTPGVSLLARGVRAIPVYRKKDNVPTEWNASAFQAVHHALGQGEAISIFPEGESGTSARIRGPLKTGTARMALGAQGAHKEVRLRIVPVHLSYSERDRYRSRAALVVGEPLFLDPGDVAKGPEDRDAVARLTERIEACLREVAFEVENERDDPTLATARRLLPLASVDDLTRLRRISQGINHLRGQDPSAADALGARAHELKDLPSPPALHSPPATGLARTVQLLALAIFAVPIGLARLLARLAPADKFVTVTMLVLLPLVALWLSTLTALAAATLGWNAGAATLFGGALLLVALPRATDRARGAHDVRKGDGERVSRFLADLDGLPTEPSRPG